MEFIISMSTINAILNDAFANTINRYLTCVEVNK
jgi:hypothetical protein